MQTPTTVGFRPAPRLLRLAAVTAALALLSACQKAPEPAAVKTAPGLRGGLQPGDTVTVVTCAEPQPGVCAIGVRATAPAGGAGDACTVTVDGAVSLPKTTATLRWELVPGDAGYNYRFRAPIGAEGPGFGVHIIDNLMSAASAASAPSTPQPIWVHQLDQPLLVQMERLVRDWPPRISAYDVYLEYQAKGAKDWTACKTWDPIIINRD